MTGTVVLDEATHEKLRLVAGALDVSESEAVSELLRRLDVSRSSAPAPNGGVAIHAVYRGERVDALFEPATGAVQITSGPLQGERFVKPSPAAVAVVRLIAPSVSPYRNGWTFWVVNATAQPIQSLRRRGSSS